MTTRQHTVVAVILTIIVGYLIRMSAVEIQPSPEGIIAQAGAVIHETGLVADLAPTSPGGLTTGLFPPGVPTMIALGMRIVGEQQFAIRWFSIFSIGLALWLLYLIGSRFLSHQGAIQAVVIAGISVPWVTYGRQANIIVAALPLILGGLWMLIRMVESKRQPHMLTYALGFVAMSGVSGWISTQAAVSLLLLSIGYASLTKRPLIALVGVIGMAASLPWIMIMFSKYGDQVLLASSIEVPYSEPLMFSTGPLDALLLLVASCAPLAAALFWCVVVVMRRSLLPTEREPHVALLALWFLVSLVIVAIQGERGFYALIGAVPAGALLSVYALERFRKATTPHLLLGAFLTVIAATLVVTAFAAFHASGAMRLILVTCMVGFIAVVVVQRLRYGGLSRPVQLAVGLYKPTYYGAIAMSAIIAFGGVVFGSPVVVQGARSVAYELHERPTLDASLTYLYHKHHSTDGMNAQLDWYTKGWLTGQRAGYTHQSIPMPATAIDEDAVRLILGSNTIVYYHPGNDRMHLEEVRALVEAMYVERVSTKDYSLFILR